MCLMLMYNVFSEVGAHICTCLRSLSATGSCSLAFCVFVCLLALHAKSSQVHDTDAQTRSYVVVVGIRSDMVAQV